MCMKLCKQKRVRIKDGRTVLLRRPEAKDLRKIMKHINAIIDEDAPIELNKRITLAAERKWMKNMLEDVKSGKTHVIVADFDGKIVGETNLTRGRGRSSHVAEYGISVAKAYRRLGVGSALTKYILDIGRRDRNIKVITLRVYEFNKKAMRMYEKFGFRKVARLSRRVAYKGKLYDAFVMDLKR